MTTKMGFLVQDVFTPSQPASLTFVERESVKKQLKTSLMTPGKQIIVYGHSGAGKTTLLVNKLEELNMGYITSRCIKGLTLNELIIDAFNQLEVFYDQSAQQSRNDGFKGEISAAYFGIKASLGGESSTGKNASKVRAVDLPITPQTLSKYFGEAKCCWVLEDFHKMDEQEKVKLAQVMKVFMDMSINYRHLKIVALGAVNTARQVVQYDPEMKNRISEIYVPLMSENELKKIIDTGCKLLNIDFEQDVKRRIITYSSGLASVTHQLCLFICIEKNIEKTSGKKLIITKKNLDSAVDLYLNENSDTFKGTFDMAVKIQHRKNETPIEILKAILSYEKKESVAVKEISEVIKKRNPSYKPNNLRRYVEELTTADRGEILRYDKNSDTFSFSNPFIRAYTQLMIKKGDGAGFFDKDKMVEDLKATMEFELEAAREQFFLDFSIDEELKNDTGYDQDNNFYYN